MTFASASVPITIFLAGDVMTGRGVDQILPTPSKPELNEDYVKRATDYVAFAARVHGPIHAPVAPAYIWGDALSVLQQVKPTASLVNLETSVTVSAVRGWPKRSTCFAGQGSGPQVRDAISWTQRVSEDARRSRTTLRSLATFERAGLRPLVAEVKARDPAVERRPAHCRPADLHHSRNVAQMPLRSTHPAIAEIADRKST